MYFLWDHFEVWQHDILLNVGYIQSNATATLHLIQWASYQIRKIAGCACAGNVFPRHRFQRKPLVSDPGMHHGTCGTHVPWCMSGSLTCGDGVNVPGIAGACAPAILRIWEEAHGTKSLTHLPKTKWPQSHRWYFQSDFGEWRALNFD